MSRVPRPVEIAKRDGKANSSLVLILGDQLSPDIDSLRIANKEHNHVLMAEVMEEATYVRHHKKKIAFVFSAMRHFARELSEAGWQVDYVRLDDPENTGTLFGELERAVARHEPDSIIITEPGEWRLRADMSLWSDRLSIQVSILDDDRFLCSRSNFKSWADGRKQLRMEHFYHDMRRKTGLLMDGTKPVGGKWNYDSENRKPPKSDLLMHPPAHFENDNITKSVLSLVSTRFTDHFGELEPFWFAVNKEQADQALDRFIEVALPSFGDYQDAMLKDERFLYHSVIALYINAGLLDPLETCSRVEQAFQTGHVPLNAAEGFIRQIIGWREYVRGIYWLRMPDYRDLNYFSAERSLPDFYWTGETEMGCMQSVIQQTREEAYAHHIQRLMVTGNFAMLAGIEPQQVHEWYLAVYADAYEWVELPNTLGMSQFADGGILGSKPYAASGNYINRMSDYCSSCQYDVKKKTGDNACPFNALYWDFLARNAVKLRSNPRLAQAYRTWDRMDAEKQAAYRESAARTLHRLQ